MSATVTIVGVAREMGGLKESLAKFRLHHQQTADVLLNISGIGTPKNQPLDQDDPRAPYVYQPYPKMLFHANGDEKIVADPKEQALAEKAGFRTTPYEKPRVVLEDPAAEKQALLARNKELEGKLTVQNEMLQKLAARLEALETK